MRRNVTCLMLGAVAFLQCLYHLHAPFDDVGQQRGGRAISDLSRLGLTGRQRREGQKAYAGVVGETQWHEHTYDQNGPGGVKLGRVN